MSNIMNNMKPFVNELIEENKRLKVDILQLQYVQSMLFELARIEFNCEHSTKACDCLVNHIHAKLSGAHEQERALRGAK